MLSPFPTTDRPRSRVVDLDSSVQLNVALNCAILCKMTDSVVERVAIVEAYINTVSVKETRKIFGSKFLGKGRLAKRANCVS